MKIDDYTRLPLGTKLEDGEIKICPHCGNNGLEKDVDGKTFYNHHTAAGYDEKGHPVVQFSYCPASFPPPIAPE
jgi:hypothetical protein